MDPDALMGRVRDVALGCLRAGGTSLEEVARRAGLDEADLCACFGDIEELLVALVAPMVDQLDGVAQKAAAADLADERELRRVIDAYLRAFLAHRVLAGALLFKREEAADPEQVAATAVEVAAAVLGSTAP